MKKALLILCVFCFSIGYTQVKNVKTDIETTSMKISTTSIQGLKNIDWDWFSFLSKLKKEFIVIEIELDLPKSKNKFKSSLKIKGESKNIKELIIKAKKRTKKLIKLAKKYDHEK